MSWITDEAAAEMAFGERFWETSVGVDGLKVELRQYKEDGPLGSPIYKYANGNLYLGEWDTDGNAYGNGILLYRETEQTYGMLYLGVFEGNECHGLGVLKWLEEAPVWKLSRNNKPYIYVGMFAHNKETCERAVSQLKNGVTRVGPWDDGHPVGNWQMDHLLVSEATVNEHLYLDAPRKKGPGRPRKRTVKLDPVKVYESLHDSEGENKAAILIDKKSREEEELEEEALAKSAPPPTIRSPAPAPPSSGRKRGRPPKSSPNNGTVTPGETKKRRGRPPKQQSPYQSASGGAPPPNVNDPLLVELQQWMASIIPYDPEPKLLLEYASELCHEGFVNVDMITEYAEEDCFGFMKKAHQKILTKFLVELRKREEQDDDEEWASEGAADDDVRDGWQLVSSDELNIVVNEVYQRDNRSIEMLFSRE